MKVATKLGVYLLPIVAAAVTALPVAAQSAKDVMGTWTLVGVTVEQGDNKVQPFGPAPKGLAMITPTHISVLITRDGVPKFASNDRMTGTDAENKSAIQGSISFYGTWTFNEADKSMSVKIEASSFPNWQGADQKRSVSITGDTMTFANPTPSAGGPGGVAKIVWKRAS